MLRGDDIVAGIEKAVSDQFDDLIRAITDDHVVPIEAKFLRNGRAQLVSAAIRINVDPFGGRLHRHDRFRRRTERIFIRGELDNLGRIESQLASRFLNRFPRIINDQILKPRMSFFNNR